MEGFIAGFLIVGFLLFIYFICTAYLRSGYTDSYNNYIEGIKEICEENNINFKEEDIEEQVMPGNFYYNSVVFENEEKTLWGAKYWIDEKKDLIFVSTEDLEKAKPGVFKVNLNKIQMYTLNGDIQYNSIVKNNGKNISLTGALVGNFIAGAPGMIIGATKDRVNIETQVEANDTRIVYVYYLDNNNEVKMFRVGKMILSDYFLFYEFIKKALPTKSSEYLMTKENIKLNNNDSISDRIKELKGIFEEGLINEEEYNERKNKLLEQI